MSIGPHLHALLSAIAQAQKSDEQDEQMQAGEAVVPSCEVATPPCEALAAVPAPESFLGQNRVPDVQAPPLPASTTTHSVPPPPSFPLPVVPGPFLNPLSFPGTPHMNPVPTAPSTTTPSMPYAASNPVPGVAAPPYEAPSHTGGLCSANDLPAGEVMIRLTPSLAAYVKALEALAGSDSAPRDQQARLTRALELGIAQMLEQAANDARTKAKS